MSETDRSIWNSGPLRAGILGLAGAMLLASAARADDSAPLVTEGAWQAHKYTFQFLGFTSTYSCDGLADKLKELLIAAGAANVKAQPGACAAPFGRPDKFARADLTFSTLAPLGPNPAGVKPVNGTWRPVVFSLHTPWDLERGDCELIEQFREHLLPMFTTRNVTNNTSCIPYQESGSTVDLRFDAFAAAPPPRTAAR